MVLETAREEREPTLQDAQDLVPQLGLCEAAGGGEENLTQGQEDRLKRSSEEEQRQGEREREREEGKKKNRREREDRDGVPLEGADIAKLLKDSKKVRQEREREREERIECSV